MTINIKLITDCGDIWTHQTSAKLILVGSFLSFWVTYHQYRTQNITATT